MECFGSLILILKTNDPTSLRFSSAPTEETVPICQMARQAMWDRRRTLVNISLRDLESKFLGDQLVLGISLELLSDGYPNLTDINLRGNQISNVSFLADAVKERTLL